MTQPLLCPTGGTHPAPANLLRTLPPLAEDPELAQALCALNVECLPCHQRNTEKAAESPTVTTNTVRLWLMAVAILAYGQEVTPPATADALMGMLMPGYEAHVSSATLTMLGRLPVTVFPSPHGRPAAGFDTEQLVAIVNSLTRQQRADVWQDALGFLVGVVLGEGRALAEQAGEA